LGREGGRETGRGGEGGAKDGRREMAFKRD